MFLFKREKTLEEMLIDCKKTRRKHFKVATELLRLCLELITKIGCPTNDKDQDELSKVIKTYDETIQTLEEYVAPYRKYVVSD